MARGIRRPGGARAAIRAAVFLLAAGCRRTHVAIGPVEPMPEPVCPLVDGGSARGAFSARGALASPTRGMDQPMRETFEVLDDGCLLRLRSSQAFPMSADTAVEAVFEPDGTPLRLIQRKTLPGATGTRASADVRLYELRGPDVTITHRAPDGTLTYEKLLPRYPRSSRDPVVRGRPRAVITTGRGMLTAWLRRAHLAPGQRVREMVLDVRDVIEVIRPCTLQRQPDTTVPWHDGPVRLYTVYGREAVYADQDDVVLGDLAGIRAADAGAAVVPPLGVGALLH